MAEDGGTTATETYNGVAVTTVSPVGGARGGQGPPAAYATFGPVLAVGDLASVKAAIDTNG